MLTDKEKEEFRRKVKSEIEARERSRLDGPENDEDAKSTEPSDKTDLRTPKSARPFSEDSTEPVSLRDNISGSDWIEIERLKNQAEEEWYSSHPDYTHYLDRNSNKKWIHKAHYEKKMARDKARDDIESARRKNLIFGSIGLGLFMVLSIMAVYYFLVPKYECSVSVESNIIEGLLFVFVVDRNITPVRIM